MSTRRGDFLTLFVGCVLSVGACTNAGQVDGGGICADDPSDLVRPLGWEVASHCKGEGADYGLVFDQSVVHRIDILIEPEIRADQMADLEDVLASGGQGPATLSVEPSFVPVTVMYGGQTWWEVGMRFKGNSSLRFSYEQGIEKLPFRLDFDEFEGVNPDLIDQRFWGFKKLTFSNGFQDNSFLRAALSTEVFRAMGVPAARVAFAAIYVDEGNGPVYHGVYSMIEDPSDDFLDDWFGDDTGNLYKPEGPGANLVTFDVASFAKKTNEDLNDYADVQAFVSALNSSRTDAAMWRANLEATVDVDTYLRALAVNQSLQNWDTYGWAPHNYYLYADPQNGGLLTWIPWDLNESLKDRTDRPNAATSGSVTLDEISDQWPWIRFLLDDPVYRALYASYLQQVLDGPYQVSVLFPLMDQWHDLLEPYAIGPDGEKAPYSFLRFDADYEQSLTNPMDGLKPHVMDRRDAVTAALLNGF